MYTQLGKIDSAPNIHELLHQELHFRRLDVGDWKLEDEDEGIRNLIFRFSFRENMIQPC